MIQPLMSQGAPIAFDKSHLMLVTDALVNLQRIERIIELIDTPARLRSIMVFFELQNVAAQEALRRLQQLQTGPLRRQLENNTAFDADDRTNQLIIFTHPSNVPLLTELVERLDIDAAPLTTTRVINIRYADAEELVGIIEQIVTGQKQVRDQAAAGSQSSRSAQQAAAAAAAARRVQTQNQTATTARAEATNLQFSDFLTIVADKRANTVVASGTPNDLRYLEELIKEIDTLLAQVRIEVVITEVRLDDSDTRGIDSFGFRYNITAGSGGAITVPGSSQKYAFPGDFYGATIDGVTWGPDGFGIQAVLNAARTNSNVSVLSAPTIVTTHNKEATVSVGEERPVLVGQTTSGVSNFVTDNIQFKDIKLELKVLPLIGSDGVIQLEINQTIQSVLGEIKIGNDFRPIVGTRAANSYVSVKDGELIVLGGLQKADISATHSRMAILGKLPIIGDLFSRKTDRNVRNELLIFIRPTIIRDTDAAHRDANQMIDTIEGTENIRSYLEEGTFRNVGQPPPKEADSATPPRRRNQP
jgi:general secretion pathway protein D